MNPARRRPGGGLHVRLEFASACSALVNGGVKRWPGIEQTEARGASIKSLERLAWKKF